jgi:hypothetical protein
MLKHQVQTHQAVLGVVEARGSRPDDVEAEGLPEVHGGPVGLDTALNWMLLKPADRAQRPGRRTV